MADAIEPIPLPDQNFGFSVFLGSQEGLTLANFGPACAETYKFKMLTLKVNASPFAISFGLVLLLYTLSKCIEASLASLHTRTFMYPG